MLEIDRLCAGYGQGDVLFNVTLAVGRGEVVTLLGRNGAGKSTTLKSIVRLVRPTAGRILFRGQTLDGLPTHKIALLGIGYVPEDRRIFPRLTVEENLLVTRSLSRNSPRNNIERIFSLFPVLRDLRKRLGGQLSGGEQQILAIARALMSQPQILLLDEPSEGLAPLVIQALAGQVKMLNGEGLTILLCEQNLGFARSLSDRVCVIDKGEVRFDGPFAEFDANPDLKKAHLFVSTGT